MRTGEAQWCGESGTSR